MDQISKSNQVKLTDLTLLVDKLGRNRILQNWAVAPLSSGPEGVEQARSTSRLRENDFAAALAGARL